MKKTEFKKSAKKSKGKGIVDSILFQNARQTVDSLATENQKFIVQETDQGEYVYEEADSNEEIVNNPIQQYRNKIKETESPDEDEEEKDDMNITLKKQSLSVPLPSKSKAPPKPQIQAKSKMSPTPPSKNGLLNEYSQINEYLQIQKYENNVPIVFKEFPIVFKPDLSKLDLHLLESVNIYRNKL